MSQAFETALGVVDLIPFRSDRLVDNSTTDFDLFLRVSDHVILYGASGYHWYRRELTELLRHGVDQFFIRKDDEYKAGMYERINQLPLVNKLEAPHERIVSIQQIGAEFTRCLFAGEITAACVAKAKNISDSLLACIAEDRTCIQALSGLADHDYYTYVHSMRVAAYALAIAIEMGLSDSHILEQLALGAMLHDIGKKDISLDLINKAGALTEEEWKILRQHPENGVKQVGEYFFSTVAKEIILHHHEKNDGSGYPHGLQKSSLLPEVQIVTLADIFDALTSSRSYQNKRSRFEGLDFIRHNMLNTKLSKEPFQALVTCLVAE